MELSTTYFPQKIEQELQLFWQANNTFSPDLNEEHRQHFSIVIPPPNVTGILHIGHVLNNTIQDILARSARQEGKQVLWLPGTDHAGIATQVKVEKELKTTTGQTKHDLGREKFLTQVWQWKDKHGSIITNQLKRLGCSCDWQRERFTMDEDYSRSVRDVFVQLFNEGLIYRGQRMINWCPSSLTALSDEEVIMKPSQAKLYYLRYFFTDDETKYIEVATTRPETIMGDVAIAVSPQDKRYAKYIGKHVYRPFPQQAIPIIADDYVDAEFGTGALKITPAHDKSDFEIGKRHQLPIIDILFDDGRINCPEMVDFHQKDRFEVRRLAIQKLETNGHFIKIENYENSVGYSERANVVIEPRLSQQWFLRYPAVDEAQQVVADDRIEFTPKRWKKTYKHWLENIQDWCISRQLWWGHRIPVWYRKDKLDQLKNSSELGQKQLTDGDIYVGELPAHCTPQEWQQDDDVLDTWFSSWLWPFATMNKAEKAKFYPTTDLVTGPDIIFFWVARMIIAGLHFENNIPFKHVYFTALIRDKIGRKMSKSLGNSPDPIDIMAQYGADGLRFALMRIAPVDGDLRFVVDENKTTGDKEYPQVAEGRNFANKIYNACRFRQMHTANTNWADLPTEITLFDLDILQKVQKLKTSLAQALQQYRFHEMAELLYNFFWSDYCDRYLEVTKQVLKDSQHPRYRSTLYIMDTVLFNFLYLLHPIMPHITEALAKELTYINANVTFANPVAIPLEQLLTIPTSPIGFPIDNAADMLYDTARKLRNLKAEYNLAAEKNITFSLLSEQSITIEYLDYLTLLAGAKKLTLINDSANLATNTPTCLSAIGLFYMPINDFICTETERKRINKERDKVLKNITKIKNMLDNPNFMQRAPSNLVQKEQLKLKKEEEQLTQLENLLNQL